MSDERTKRRVAPNEKGHRAEGPPREAEREQGRPTERRPSPLEREWRGSGVCGDKHTD